ncbi:MAG TPA: NTP transferase domain-containing protein [bacterium]|nr:NTP transferase domain-containing protein [bacterium]
MPDAQTSPGPRAGQAHAGVSDVLAVTVVVLAGGKPDPALTGAPLPKAFAPLCGRTMVEFVLDALRGTNRTRRIILVGPETPPPALAAVVDVTVRERGGLLENLAAALAELPGDAPVLAVAADVPLLTPLAVSAFLDAALALDADIVYGVVPRADVMRVYPDARKTFVRLRDGVFTGGSLVLLRPRAFERARPVLERAIRARKRPWDLARLFGPATLLGLATGRLRISGLEARVATIAGVRARAVICHEPEIAVDVDRAEDLVLAEGWLTAQAVASHGTEAGEHR